jgi:hypothetical protein
MTAGLNAGSQKAIYFTLLDVIRGRLQLWSGSPDRKEMRARIAVGKNLLAGDTFYEIAQKAEDDPDGPWKSILLKYVEGAVELIEVGNDLVSLEALRAANHSLVRLCQRLSEARKSSRGRLRVLRWPFFRSYFSQLVHGAVQRLDANLRFRDAMSHEFARTFALSIYACPEGILNISSELVESGLIRDPWSDDDLTRGIEGQVGILSMVFNLSGILDLWKFVQDVHLHFSVEALPASSDIGVWEEERKKALGLRNISCLDESSRRWLFERLQEYGDLYRFVSRFKLFVDNLSSDARQLHLVTVSGISSMRMAIPEREYRGISPCSWDFWDHAIGELAKIPGIPEIAPLRIRPEAILFFDHVCRWAELCLANLDRRYSDRLIFEPEYGLFREILSRLERASRELSSSVAMNMVVGVLGHHLLEELDLHVLELREIARNLDPTQDLEGTESSYSASNDEVKSTSGRFASLLGRRAKRAQSLPKTLRALSRLLESPIRASSANWTLSGLFRSDLWNLSEWGPDDVRISSRRELEYLALAIGELEENFLLHSGFQGDGIWLPIARLGEKGLIAKFPVSKSPDRRWELVERVAECCGQNPFRPNPFPGVPSSGMGFYLSCLAAAMVGWELIASVEKSRDDGSLAGWLIVELRPVNRLDKRRLPFLEEKSAEPPRENATITSNVVVIDDRQEVAYYVWRELGQVTGFGSAEVGGDAVFSPKHNLEPLHTPSGEIRVWWVSASAGWEIQLKELLSRPDFHRGAFFLVDVRGPVDGGSQDGSEGAGYRCEEVLEAVQKIEGKDFTENTWLMCSYEHGVRTSTTGSSIEIRSKSPEMLAALRNRLTRKTEAEPEFQDEAHILVTGAGFEVKGYPEKKQLGIPSTGALLERWARRAYPDDTITWNDEYKFPVPKSLESVEEFKVAAKYGDLDQYWSILLRKEREKAKRDVLEAAAREYYLRQFFRDEFIGHDWGHLPQSIAAAQIKWSAWISTNYTRFTNRAIELSKIKWRTIEFGEEAQNFNQHLLHGAGLPGESILFKVHGDIGHVLTMALSTEDKTVETRLSSFMPLYLASQSCITEMMRKFRRIVWHIVGHGLKDRLLMHLITGAYKARRRKHEFVVIAPEKTELRARREHPSFLLHKKLGSRAKNRIEGRYARADEYMTRLKRVGLARYEEVLQELEKVPL